MEKKSDAFIRTLSPKTQKALSRIGVFEDAQLTKCRSNELRGAVLDRDQIDLIFAFIAEEREQRREQVVASCS